MPELSIIVPVYKVELYLRRCVDSILAQTFRDFELILIDDGSPDNCGAICDEYAEKDKRILIIHQQNKGVSAARNMGIDAATGTYLTFVDADDWIMPEMYAEMLSAAQTSKADIVVCGFNYVNEYGEYQRSDIPSEGVYNSVEALATLFGMPNCLSASSCNKLFFRTAIENIRFREGIRMGEDGLYLFDCYMVSCFVKKIPDCLYNVTERRGSATRCDSVDYCYETLSGSRLLLQLAHVYSRELECKATDKYLDDCLRYVPNMKEIGKRTSQPYRMKFLHIKWLMLKVIVRAYIHKLLPRAKIHGYIMGMIKL